MMGTHEYRAGIFLRFHLSAKDLKCVNYATPLKIPVTKSNSKGRIFTG